MCGIKISQGQMIGKKKTKKALWEYENKKFEKHCCRFGEQKYSQDGRIKEHENVILLCRNLCFTDLGLKKLFNFATLDRKYSHSFYWSLSQEKS